MNTPIQVLITIVALAFLLVLFKAARHAHWTFTAFGGFALIIVGVVIWRDWPKPTLEKWVRVIPQNAQYPHIKIEKADVTIPLKNEPYHKENLDTEGIVLKQYREDQLPATIDNWLVTVEADGFKTGKAKLQVQPDGSHQAIVDMVPQSAPPEPPKDPILPAQSSLPATDVRTWKIALFGCTEHIAQSIPLAQRIQKALLGKGYQTVTTKAWPLAGTQNASGSYYALTSELTVNYTGAKVDQATQLLRDLRTIEELPKIESKEVGSEFSRYLSVVACPGFMEKDRFE